jgi:CHAT domain-containing protein
MGKIRQGCLLFCLSLVATLPMVGGRGFASVPAVMAQNTDTRKTEADKLLQLCRQNLNDNQAEAAIKSCQQAITAHQQIQDLSGEAKSSVNLGIAYIGAKQYPQAISILERAAKIGQESKEPRVEALAFFHLGRAYGLSEQAQKSTESFQQALTIAQEIQDAELEKNIQQLLAAREQPPASPQKQEADRLFQQGIQQFQVSQFREALQSWEQALQIYREIGDRQGEAASLGNLGIAYRSLGQYEKAIEYHQQSLAIAKEIGDRQGEALSLNNLGAAYRDNQQPLEAIKHLEASLTIYIEIRRGLSRDDRKQFLASNERTVITLAEVLIQQNQPEKAFEWLNLATTADLADYDRLINAQVKNPAAQAALDKWKANNKNLQEMRQQLQNKHSDELAIEIRQFEAQVNKEGETIGQKYPEVAELFETTTTDIAQLRQNIAPDTLVIQPVPLRDKVALFLVTREKLIVIQSDTKAVEFNQIVSQYRSQLADRRNADTFVTGGKLYEILIRPIESQISASSPKNIAIIATGQLRYIPFETLYDEKTDQYLLQKYPIHYLTRISTAIAPTTSRNNTLKIMAFANPKPTQQTLEGAEKEVDSISKTFPGSEKYFGTEATLDIFKKRASLFPILHLATHGCFDPNGCADLAMQANTILFANSQQYPIAEAALLGLENTELITLSACQTAKEANAEGQEISGLAYVLERAGAKSVIASLWSAEDGTTADIMIQFYQNLQKGMTKTEAMRQAKLSNINSHPFFWSPFILIGDAN